MNRKIRLLFSGNPCTTFSVAQTTAKREREPDGEGWELFRNSLIAIEKFKPDYFLFENVNSMSPQVRDAISAALNVQPVMINSALVSAQQRKRLYWANFPIEQPQDRGIYLDDIIEAYPHNEVKALTVTATAGNNITLPHVWIKRSRNCIPIRVGHLPPSTSQANRIYSYMGKSVCLNAGGGGAGAKTGLYAIPTDSINGYLVKDRQITIKDKTFPLDVPDGVYIIRKLTINECAQLQTFPPDYFYDDTCELIVSETQTYKAIGNAWTLEVIKHILAPLFQDVNQNEIDVEVLSMYDGIGTAFEVLTNFVNPKRIHYQAYEINQFAISIAQHNHPNIVERGDAYDLRKADWSY